MKPAVFREEALLTAHENEQAGQPVSNLSTVTVAQRQSQKKEFQMCEESPLRQTEHSDWPSSLEPTPYSIPTHSSITVSNLSDLQAG